MKIVKYLKDSGLLIKSVTQTIKNEAKKQRVGFLGMLLGTLSVSVLGNLFAGKDVTRTNWRGLAVIQAGKRKIKSR